MPSNKELNNPQALGACTKALKDAHVFTLDTAQPQLIPADSLWKDTGCVMMVIRRTGWGLCIEEAIDLSSLKPRLDELGVKLLGVTHQTIGVPEFKKYFQGEVYHDQDRFFYKALGYRWSSKLGLLSPSVVGNFYRAMVKKNLPNNSEGEGLLLGGVLVIGPGEQGVVYQYYESVIGDHAKPDEVLDAVERMVKDHVPGAPKSEQ